MASFSHLQTEVFTEARSPFSELPICFVLAQGSGTSHTSARGYLHLWATGEGVGLVLPEVPSSLKTFLLYLPTMRFVRERGSM